MASDGVRRQVTSHGGHRWGNLLNALNDIGNTRVSPVAI
jgi:hypothetical protein